MANLLCLFHPHIYRSPVSSQSTNTCHKKNYFQIVSMKKATKKRSINKYEHLAGPEACLDFHDLGVLLPVNIEARLEAFLQKASRQGKRKLLVITGRGLHSRNGPVVKPTVEKLLGRNPLVHRYKEARRDRGGEGAYEVELL